MNDEPRPTLRPRRLVNLTACRCPISMIRAKVALDSISAGETIELVLAEGEQIQDIPCTLKQEGHRIIAVVHKGATHRLTVCKGR